MVREAQKAGLDFDETKLDALYCFCDEDQASCGQATVPAIEIDPGSPQPVGEQNSINSCHDESNDSPRNKFVDDVNFAVHHHTHLATEFHRKYHYAATQGRIHDVLQFNNGAGRMSVVCWNIMEYLPFRRMDLREDGTWKAITWPLPKGETRDIPANAVIHSSVIKRMLADPTYRPGNLIVGGGGRGVRHAPKEMGIGKWVCVREENHPVGECFERKEPPTKTKTDESIIHTAMPSGP